MKPSEKIKAIYLDNSAYTMQFVFEGKEILAYPHHVMQAILDYLDEEAEKTKYACPNCNRVVDKILEQPYAGPLNRGSKAGCKYCLIVPHSMSDNINIVLPKLSRMIYPPDTDKEFFIDEFGNRCETDNDFKKRYEQYLKENIMPMFFYGR